MFHRVSGKGLFPPSGDVLSPLMRPEMVETVQALNSTYDSEDSIAF